MLEEGQCVADVARGEEQEQCLSDIALAPRRRAPASGVAVTGLNPQPKADIGRPPPSILEMQFQLRAMRERLSMDGIIV